MSQSRNPAEQLAREIAREAGFLPERWRLWLFEELRKDFEAADLEQHRIDDLNQKMSQAVQALERVAKHLKLKGKEARLALTMREFDAAPERVRKGWTGRRIADAVRGSWRLAKSVAFTDTALPVFAERQAEQRAKLARKRREAAFGLSSVKDWLATNPADKRKPSYDRWRKEQTRQPGQKPILTAQRIRFQWGGTWAEIVKTVERDEVPGENQPDEPDVEHDQPEISDGPAPDPTAENYVLDSKHRAQLIRRTREARGWSITELAHRAELDASSLSQIERNRAKNPSFETILKLAIALQLPIKAFATTD